METSENTVVLNPDGFIEITLVGNQTGEAFLDVYHKALPMIEKIKTEKRPLLGLCDLTKQSGFSLSSDKVAMEYLEKTDYDKLAMYNVPHKEVTKGIIIAMGKSDNTKIFDNRDKAVEWLLGLDEQKT